MMQEYVEANQQLHAELTALQARHEELASSLHLLRDQNAILQAQVLTDSSLHLLRHQNAILQTQVLTDSTCDKCKDLFFSKHSLL